MSDRISTEGTQAFFVPCVGSSSGRGSRLRVWLSFAIFLAVLWGSQISSGQVQESAEGNPLLATAVRVGQAPRLDGTLDDPLWQLAKPITNFRQKEPHEGEPATEQTEVRILYTRHAVYFGIQCFDSEPSQL